MVELGLTFKVVTLDGVHVGEDHSQLSGVARVHHAFQCLSSRKAGHAVFRTINEQTRGRVQSPVDQGMRESKAVGLANPTTLISRDAKELSIDDSAAPIRSADGRLIGTVVVFRDVTERRDAERRSTFIASATAQLASSLDYKQTLATVSRLAVPLIADWCAVDLVDGKTLHRVAVDHVDPEKVRLVYDIQMKYPEDPERPGGAYEIIRTGKPIFIPEIPDELLAAAARDEEHLALIRQLQLRSYIGMPLMINGAVVGVLALAMAESGRVYGSKDLDLASALADRAALAVNHARLFAESAAARIEAERANRAKDEFLAMLGHELRNPLAPILTALQLMKLRGSGNLDREQAILERQVKQVVALVDDLLDISRITRGKIQHVSEVVDLSATVGRALEVTSLRMKENSHNVVTNVPPGLLVGGDQVRLTQVFTNLITNAAKYTPPGGLIHITGTRQDETLVVVVKDNGVGIAPDLLPRLFDMFVQGEQPLDRAKGGLGLGLAIVRSLVELHGGQVFASSAGINQGSEFRVVLPALNATAQPVLETKKDELKITTALKVLLVDDNEDALELLGEALKLVGYETFAAPNSFAALSLAAVVKPHVALLDIGLPDIDGYELARRLRALEGLSTIKLVALTGYSQATDRSKTADAGFDEHLVKPTSLDQIQEVIQRLTAAKA